MFVPIASLPGKVLNLVGTPSSVSSITYTWDKLVGETNVGSTDPDAILGYELWIDDGLGGSFSRVYDGFYKPHTTEYTA